MEDLMPQISLYLDENILQKIERRAKQDNTSVSDWVGKQIEKSVINEYPSGFFDLFGALKDISLERPPQGSFEEDCSREQF
jgi:hypothetical protein